MQRILALLALCASASAFVPAATSAGRLMECSCRCCDDECGRMAKFSEVAVDERTVVMGSFGSRVV